MKHLQDLKCVKEPDRDSEGSYDLRLWLDAEHHTGELVAEMVGESLDLHGGGQRQDARAQRRGLPWR
jgi:hypothetical protein